MNIKIRNRRFTASMLTLAVLATAALVALPGVQAQDQIGKLTVTGMVKVNGKPAATGDIVSSGSTVETTKGSSAVVSLGKLGRVEAQAETKMQLRWDETSITIMLEAGRVRVSTGSGVTATVIRAQ